jgi:hypothetical protein
MTDRGNEFFGELALLQILTSQELRNVVMSLVALLGADADPLTHLNGAHLERDGLKLVDQPTPARRQECSQPFLVGLLVWATVTHIVIHVLSRAGRTSCEHPADPCQDQSEANDWPFRRFFPAT